MRKCARILRSGGTLAIVHTHWVSGEQEDSFARESQECYARWDPDYDPTFKLRGPGDLPPRNVELENSGLFDEVVRRRYFCGRDYDAAAYRDLLGTFSKFPGVRPWAPGGLFFGKVTEQRPLPELFCGLHDPSKDALQPVIQLEQ